MWQDEEPARTSAGWAMPGSGEGDCKLIEDLSKGLQCATGLKKPVDPKHNA